MTEADVRRLLAEKKIRTVRPDPETAQVELDVARRHIASAEKIMDDDPTLAFTALYDAIRKAIAAHMRSRGYRVTRGLGAHAKTGSTRSPHSTTWTSRRTSTSSTRSAISGTRANTRRSPWASMTCAKLLSTPRRSSTLSRVTSEGAQRSRVRCRDVRGRYSRSFVSPVLAACVHRCVHAARKMSICRRVRIPLGALRRWRPAGTA